MTDETPHQCSVTHGMAPLALTLFLPTVQVILAVTRHYCSIVSWGALCLLVGVCPCVVVVCHLGERERERAWSLSSCPELPGRCGCCPLLPQGPWPLVLLVVVRAYLWGCRAALAAATGSVSR